MLKGFSLACDAQHLRGPTQRRVPRPASRGAVRPQLGHKPGNKLNENRWPAARRGPRERLKGPPSRAGRGASATTPVT